MPSDKYTKRQQNIYFKQLDIKKKIFDLAEKEKRTFSDMMIILCEEALIARQKEKLAS